LSKASANDSAASTAKASCLQTLRGELRFLPLPEHLRNVSLGIDLTLTVLLLKQLILLLEPLALKLIIAKLRKALAAPPTTENIKAAKTATTQASANPSSLTKRSTPRTIERQAAKRNLPATQTNAA
jgi:hypothetical protein